MSTWALIKFHFQLCFPSKQSTDRVFYYLTELVVKAVGEKSYEEGMEVMFEMFQKPKLNKQVCFIITLSFTCNNIVGDVRLVTSWWLLQLSYMLLDELLREAFPELLRNVERPMCTPNKTLAVIIEKST